MSKVAFIFPGQGSQYIGMSKAFYENNPKCKAIFDEASKAVDLDLAALCFEENENLNITEYTQIAMLVTEVAMCEAVKELGITPNVTAGLSLGEYSALVLSGVLKFDEACKVVRKRGIYMQDEVPVGKGGMAAIIGLDGDVIAKICEETEGVVTVANYNCPGQIVISGELGAVERACENLKAAGAKRCISLNVSGPFHSPMLAGAGEKLAAELENITVSDIQIPYATNVTGEIVKDKNQVKDLLTRQVSSSVRWIACVEAMLAEGVDTFIEIGPGKTLCSFVKKINKEVTVFNVDKFEDLDKIKEALC